LEYDLKFPDKPGTKNSYNLAETTPFSNNVPIIDSRKTHLTSGSTKWYIPKPNDRILQPATRD
jgi:hypothetical protein